MKPLSEVQGQELEFAIHDLDGRIIEVRAGSDRIAEVFWHDPGGVFVEARTAGLDWAIRTSEAAIEVREIGCDCLVGMLDRATNILRVAGARPLTWSPETGRLILHDGSEALAIEGRRIRLAPLLREHPDGPLIVLLAVHLNALRG